MDEIIKVSELPKVPDNNAIYSFTGIPKSEIVGNNHGLHKYPAKFIPQFPKWALNYLDSDAQLNILDPYCGSGTTLVEAGTAGHHAYGVDISPLAKLISEAKTSIIAENFNWHEISSDLIKSAKSLANEYEKELDQNVGKNCLGMHWTWSNWFESGHLSKLLALKTSIAELKNDAIRTFALACLSSITKSASYLNEDQIKVKYQEGKKLKDPFEYFPEIFSDAVSEQLKLSMIYQEKGSTFFIENRTASDTGILGSSIDAIITSPPYINAVDYTMAHKYNMFVLGLLEPDDFKDHCREYIGVTERAVRSQDLVYLPQCDDEGVQKIIESLWEIGTPTAKNRAYVVSQYFNGMIESFKEMKRVLVDNGKIFFVVGETNRICGLIIPTAQLLKGIAQSEGFTIELEFFHRIANRSAMRMNRSETGGSIKNELVYVFRK